MDQAGNLPINNNSYPPTYRFHYEKFAYCILTLSILWSAAGDINVFYSRQIEFIVVGIGLFAAYYFLHKDISFLTENISDIWKGAIVGFLAGIISIIFMNIIPVPQHIVEELSTINYLGLVLFLFLSIPFWEVISRHVLTPIWGAASVAFLDAVLFGIGTQNVALFIVTFFTCWGAAIAYKKYGFPAGVLARIVATALAFILISYSI